MSKLAVLLAGAGAAVGAIAYQGPAGSDGGAPGLAAGGFAIERPSPDNEVVRQYCVRCHNDRRLLGGMSLERFDAADAVASAELAERVIRKLRAGMMPPPGARRPDEHVLTGLAVSLEEQLDRAAEHNSNPGRRTFQRLNRAEYAASVRDLLDLQIDAGKYLPLDTKSANFDNIADVQLLSATLATGYLRAAAEVSRLALGDPHVTPSEATYRVSRWDSQTERAEGVALRHAGRRRGRAQLSGGRRIRLPRVVPSRDHGRALRQRPQRPPHGRRDPGAAGDIGGRRACSGAGSQPLDARVGPGRG